jgi:hypothetical protein
MKTLLLLLLSTAAIAQISLNPLSKYMKRVEYVFDSIVVDKSHQILVICGDSVLITLPDTTMLNADWGTYQQAGYGYQPEDYQYNLDIRFAGTGTLFFSDSIAYNTQFSQETNQDSSTYHIVDTTYKVKEFLSTNPDRYFRMEKNQRCWIKYLPHYNQFYIYKKEEL